MQQVFTAVYQSIIGALEELEREGKPVTNGAELAQRLASLVMLSGRLQVTESFVAVTERR